MGQTPSTETMLAAACCRIPTSPEGAHAVRQAAAEGIDWDRFLHVVDRHRIGALVWDGLRRAELPVPINVRDTLGERTAQIAQTNLRLAAEEARIGREFARHGVALLFVKGTTGALLAYGSLTIKQAWDIDLVVGKADAEPASALLAGLGYERQIPGPELSGSEFRRWAIHSKEMLYFNRARSIWVELHTALVDNAQLLPGVGMASPRQTVRHGEALALPTLATEELFAYLCVHGTLHFWSRLKWLADVAALIATNQLDCERLYRSSLDLGAGRAAAVALLLCNRLFATAVPEQLLAELGADPAATALADQALDAMKRCETEADGSESAWQMLRQQAALFRVKPGLRYAFVELRNRLFYPHSPLHLKVWTPLWPLLTLIQFPRFVLKRRRLRREARLPRAT